MVNWKSKYLKYKLKYQQLLKHKGGSDPVAPMYSYWDTEENIIKRNIKRNITLYIDNINKEMGAECLKLAFLDETLLDEYNNTLSEHNNKIESIPEDKQDKMAADFNEWCLKNMFNSDYEINVIPTHLHQPNIEYQINPYSGKPHREFTKGKDYGNPHYNVLAYLQISNCSNLSKAGTGLIYPTSTGECKIKILPIIPGMVIAMRDACFYHFTPPAISFIDSEICMRRTLFRCFIDKIGDTIEPDIVNLKKCLKNYTYLDDEEEPVIKSEFIKELQ